MSYTPLKIAGNSTGLVKYREEFLLPDDAYPVLENAFVWRERIKRKQGYELLGRLQRNMTAQVLGNTVASQTSYTFTNLFASITPPLGASEPNKSLVPGSLVITVAAPDAATFTDNKVGGFTVTGKGASGTINYATGAVTLVFTAPVIGAAAMTAVLSYTPGLPVMGLRNRELTAVNNEQMVAFDQIYAYRYIAPGFEEFLPGTTWTGSDSDFFWSTNYWVGTGNLKLFWVTNFVDPIRYTNGITTTNWINFAPIINASGETLNNALCMLPFRGRMMAFNTKESISGSHSNRIRWAQIGNPFTTASAIVTVVSADAWKDDIRGKGGFLDIPTNEDIITVGFVRDNLVIYCERSTWQLRYTGRSIAPFQIEKVNSELGVESTFSGVQFDTSLVGIGDKGVVECDSYKSERIDIKIVDLVIDDINNINNGTKRVHGIRDFQQRLAFWTYPQGSGVTYPNKRLVYNYENDSWAIFTDSLTCFGTYQDLIQRRWNTEPTISWRQANFPWVNRPSLFPSIMGGNQQGYVLFLDEQTTNQESLFITAITGNTTTPTVITSPSHNLQVGQVIQITSIIGTGYASLNNQIFGVTQVITTNTFLIQKYNPDTGNFDSGEFDVPATYMGGGQIRIRDNFRVASKKFNFMDEGKQIQLGYLDILFDGTPVDPDFSSAITMNVYTDYNDGQASNRTPQNQPEDTFFNSIVDTSANTGVNGGSKNWKRVFCPTNANFVTIEYTLNNEQMTNQCQETNVQIDAQVLWRRTGGRLGITN